MLIALTRAVPSRIGECELTHLDRKDIDPERAAEQHLRYEEALDALGCTVEHLPAAPHLPDSVFVEDTAVVLPELAIIARPGAASRRAEVEPVASALERYRPLAHIGSPGTLDGGDVLRVGSRIFVGGSGRTNAEGIRQLRELTTPFGYLVIVVPASGCLHLKTAVTEVADRTLLLNPAWVDPAVFVGFDLVEVDPREPFGANALRIGDAVIHPVAFPRTADRLRRNDVEVQPVPADELAKAEAGVTCCSLLVPA